MRASESRTLRHDADVLIIGGGTAGCMAATICKEKDPGLNVMIVEKAHIRRSGCLAAGMNAINAFINPGETPESFTRFARNDACGLIRDDLVLANARRLNEMVGRVESWGLPIVKDDEGHYQRRGRWNIEILGESLKPILAEAVRRSGTRVLNRVAATGLIQHRGRVVGATALGVRDASYHVILARAIIVATGGAAGLYRPNNPGSAHHKIWYCPFNTGAGYAMGIRAGAEMTSLEMRFIALRTKDAIAPTGTLALGFGASQVNAYGEQFMRTRYAEQGGERAPTPWRTYAPTAESMEGRGPCYLDTRGLSPERVDELRRAYLNMYPGIVLYWDANGMDPSREPVEICGTEPYVMGGHCQAGYWVDGQRQTTLPGLFAAGDVSGGAPYKFVSGCWAEGAEAAESAVKALGEVPDHGKVEDAVSLERERVYAPMHREALDSGISPRDAEERLQKVMDEYAGGLATGYASTKPRLDVALARVEDLHVQLSDGLSAETPHDLMLAHEVLDRVWVARALVRHLAFREETRWPAFQSRADFPKRDDESWDCFVNSRYDPGAEEWAVFKRPDVRIM